MKIRQLNLPRTAETLGSLCFRLIIFFAFSIIWTLLFEDFSKNRAQFFYEYILSIHIN